MPKGGQNINRQKQTKTKICSLVFVLIRSVMIESKEKCSRNLVIDTYNTLKYEFGV